MALHAPVDAKIRDELLENFFRLLQRSYSITEKKGHGLATYRSIAGLVYRLCGEPWGQRTIFSSQTALIRQFLAETELPPVANPDAIVQKSLMANSWKAIANSILQTLDRQDFASLCIVKGEENLRAAQAAGRGIVLVHSHTLFAQLFWVWLEHEGIAPGVTSGKRALRQSPSEIQDPAIRAVEIERERLAAVAALREGGMVDIVPDGGSGRQAIVLPFCNRRRSFRPSFAQLALSTNACVLPVVVKSSPDGHFRIEIGSPFTSGPSRQDTGEQVELMVRQYAEHLHRLWQEVPADIPWVQMMRHLKLPPL